MEGRTNLHLNSMRLPVSAKIKVEKDNCLRLKCKVKTNDHWLVSWVIISTFHIGWIGFKLRKKRGKFKLQYVQCTERILKESNQTVYHTVCRTNDNTL